ncbi:hypothetical protein HB662_12735 [Roseomonas frigidaquae]|uniref:DUF5668 domain-containing protein n=1 Tax=Falsiroseomonas frigidaquae TaxID=487318 RepID=A0ABX1F001_9PROT|nr:hypothetical protein [Falsiroseomonas frigidaquae]NKE45648.1 hypothetical protein [Falsiroseomonas frigidaquae]
MNASHPGQDEDEEAPPSILPQAILIGILALVGIGFAAFEVLGLQADDLGGAWPLVLGGMALLIILRITLRP